ncbi:MAG: hypothetical protein WDO56_03890 [Gammaproteobacteria bacterium]
MSAASAIRKVLSIETAAEREKRISEMGHAACELFVAVSRRLGELRQPGRLSEAQFLKIEPVVIAIDFLELDRMLALLEQEVASTPSASLFVMEGSMQSIDEWLMQLRAVAQEAAPYRKFMGGASVSAK